MIEGEMVTVQLSDVIMPGEPGKKRSIFIKDTKTGGEALIAKFIDFQDERFRPESGTTTILFKVKIRGDESDVRIIEMADILPRFPTKHECLHQDTTLPDFLERKSKAICLRFALAVPRPENGHYMYPFFEYFDLVVLWRLVTRLRQEVGNNYPFNLLIIRFSICWSQKDYIAEVEQPIGSEIQEFKKFHQDYKAIVGTVMVSNVKRCSKFSVQKICRLQFAVAKALRVSSKCALHISDKFFTAPEIGVVLRKGLHDFVPHSSLEQLE